VCDIQKQFTLRFLASDGYLCRIRDIFAFGQLGVLQPCSALVRGFVGEHELALMKHESVAYHNAGGNADKSRVNLPLRLEI
jgi:hypothetical protein